MRNITFQFNVPVTILREKSRYVAYTPALDLSTSGKTYAQAKKRFAEIVDIFFEELIRKDTLQDVLLDLGWTKAHKHWRSPMVVSQESEVVKIPIKT